MRYRALAVMRTLVPIERLLARADDVLAEQARIAGTATGSCLR